MFCTGCEQHLPPSEFWNLEAKRFLARCASCRFKAGQAAFEGAAPQRQADDITKEDREAKRAEVHVLRNLSARSQAWSGMKYRLERSNVRPIVIPGYAEMLAWTFENNPQLGGRASQG